MVETSEVMTPLYKLLIVSKTTFHTQATIFAFCVTLFKAADLKERARVDERRPWQRREDGDVFGGTS